ncbi:response regulator [Exilibacterium tricleocarpae]|uniref:Response regulator n=1 Tax=Exilibacterium tricleocarpae TaxID=2591008 RepID=A0A545SP28_9GAMM|nr:sigma 54-interacting transcriptional regulator [Exilibacterium tricleocarpae]TQV66711.1 response regulator [Exilibacterium tricleocarpae]
MNAPRVLVVDDDEGLLKLIAIRLRRSDYDVTTVGGGQQALDSLSRQLPHVVVTDLQMDGMDGMALFEAIKSRFPLLPVIVLTAHGTIPDAVAATKDGVFAFLTKPFNGDALISSIQEAVELSLDSGVEISSGSGTEWRGDIVTRNAEMEKLLAEAKMAARSEASILIQCDSGTGKELLAKAIHKASLRSAAAFVGVNCTAIPEALFESEFFGHVKGAFSGATANRQGLFENANGGTLFLDEIGDMSLELQSKLLRVLEEREVRPVGANDPIPIDVRIICATHQNLEEAVAERRFREDLYYRLNVVFLEIPPLSRRREDIPLLANTFLNSMKTETGAPGGFAPEALKTLMSAQWPGNVRQLRNVVEQCAVLCKSPLVTESFVQRALRSNVNNNSVVPFAEARDEFEREYLIELLRMTCGNVTRAAKLARRNRSEFYKLLNKHHLEALQFRQLINE